MSGRFVSSLYLDFQSIALYSSGNSDTYGLNWGKDAPGNDNLFLNAPSPGRKNASANKTFSCDRSCPELRCDLS